MGCKIEGKKCYLGYSQNGLGNTGLDPDFVYGTQFKAARLEYVLPVPNLYRTKKLWDAQISVYAKTKLEEGQGGPLY